MTSQPPENIIRPHVPHWQGAQPGRHIPLPEEEELRQRIEATVHRLGGNAQNQLDYVTHQQAAGTFLIDPQELAHRPLRQCFAARGLPEPAHVEFLSVGPSAMERHLIPPHAWDAPVAHFVASPERYLAAAPLKGGIAANFRHMSGLDKAWTLATAGSAALSLLASVHAFRQGVETDPQTDRPHLRWSQLTYGAFEAAFGALMAYSTAQRLAHGR